MSVIVRGMKMPKDCFECMVDCPVGTQRFIVTGRPRGCPLVELPEKHGRLVDADKLADLLLKEKEKVVGEGNLLLCFAVGFAWGFITKEPPVVEAEGSEE